MFLDLRGSQNSPFEDLAVGVLIDIAMNSGPCGSEYDLSHRFLYWWGIEEKQRWEVNLSRCHA